MDLLWTRASYDQASCRCGWNAKHALLWMQMIEENRLLPRQIGDFRLSWAMEKIQCMQETQQLDENAYCDSARWHRKPDWRGYLIPELKKLREAAGISLETFRDSVLAEEHRSVK